jgi:hypothetical protein
MRIIYGYGACRFRITYVDSNGNTGWENIDLRVNNNTFPNDTEVGYNFVNIYGNEVRSVSHIKRSFQVDLLYNDTTQADILNLIAKLHKNPRSFFYFYLHNPTTAGFSGWYEAGNELCRYVCTTDIDQLRNLVSNFSGSGQVLSLNIKVRDKIAITSDKYTYIPYRDTSTGLWGSYPTLPSNVFGSQSPIIGMITT